MFDVIPSLSEEEVLLIHSLRLSRSNAHYTGRVCNVRHFVMFVTTFGNLPLMITC